MNLKKSNIILIRFLILDFSKPEQYKMSCFKELLKFLSYEKLLNFIFLSKIILETKYMYVLIFQNQEVRSNFCYFINNCKKSETSQAIFFFVGKYSNLSNNYNFFSNF
jgi:hypothetical protein